MRFVPRLAALAVAAALPTLSQAITYDSDQKLDQSNFTEQVTVINGAAVTVDAEEITGKRFLISNYSSHVQGHPNWTQAPSKLVLGSEQTKSITIANTSDGFTYGIGIQGPANANFSGSTAEVNAQDLRINLHSTGDYAYGLYVMNASTNKRGDDGSLVGEYSPVKLTINAENTYIDVSTNVLVDPNDQDHRAIGIVALSEGEIEFNGNLFVNAPTAISTRGKAVVNINKESDANRIVQLNGDINFNYNKETSGTPVKAFVTINLANADSWLNGDIVINGVDIPEDYDNVDDMNLGLSNGARWIVPKDAAEDTVADKQAPVNLTMSNGVLRIEDSAKTINLKSFNGSGGLIQTAAVQNGDKIEHAKVAIEAMTAEDAEFQVEYLGLTADDVTDANAALESMHAVISAPEGSEFTQLSTIAEGDIRGALTETLVNGESQGVSEASNTKLEAFKGVNASALVQWRNQINHLTKRLGDIRQQPNGIGAWARIYGGEYKWGHGNDVDMTSTSVQVGCDGRIGDWIVGGAFSYTDSSFDLDNGDGDGDMYSLAVYGTRMFDSGAYVDLVARYGYIKNDLQVKNMDVNFDSNAFSVSVESGHQFKFMERAYVEPQVEITYGYAQGDDAKASNGVKIDQDDYQNLVTRVGFRTGFDFPEDAGTIYAHVSYSYDFFGDADGTASKDGIRASLDQDLGGGWVTYGIGGQFKIGESAFAYADLERTTGGDVENPYAFNVGFRYVF